MRPVTNPVQVATAWSWNTWQLREHRIITLSGEIDSTTSDQFQDAIFALALESNQPIKILLHSRGGEVLEGLGIFDSIVAMGEYEIHTTVHATGPVASMAAIILQAADHRVMTPNSRILLHEVREFSFMSSTTVSDAVDQARQLEAINDRLAILVADRTNGMQTPDSIKARWSKDYWLWPEEALEQGLIDEVAPVMFK